MLLCVHCGPAKAYATVVFMPCLKTKAERQSFCI
jgi:hypothetical protein